MGATIQPEAAWLIQVTYETSGRQLTCTRFSRTGNAIEFLGKRQERLVFDATGKTPKELMEWMEARLNNYTNSKCKILKYKEISEEDSVI